MRRYQFITLSIIIILLISDFPVSFASASPSGVTYYVDVNHAEAEDSDDHGSIEKPWRTLKYAFEHLQSGDTLLVREGTYQNVTIRLTAQHSGQEDMPITVKAYPGETVILRAGGAIRFQGANWWIIEGLIFDEPAGQYMQLGLHESLGNDQTVAAEHITIRNCEFKNGTRAVISMNFANDILIENNYFHHVRPGVPFYDENGNKIGWEINAISVRYKGNHIVIKDNRFEEIGSDGVQLGSKAYLAGSEIGVVTILGNEFWVNRPYTGILGNVGENGIDIKGVIGPVLISGNTIHGFRPTTPQQDASGAHGDGIVIHDGARNVTVEKNLFYDNTVHLVISTSTDGESGGTREIAVRNNIFRGARASDQAGVSEGGFALNVKRAAQVQVYHNTFYDNDVYLRSMEAVGGVYKNNVIFKGEGKMITSHEGWEADYNAWSQIEGVKSQVMQGSHDLTLAELKLGWDLRPLPNSLVINAGQNLGVTDDFDGNLRFDGLPDLGAFEYINDVATSTPTPTNTAYPTHTPTIPPTSTPIPTHTFTPLPPTPTPTVTPLPPTPTPTVTPSPTNTPVPTPTNTAYPTHTPTIPPTSTPIPTHTFTPLPPTPTPTMTSSPTNTPVPTPTNTAYPTHTPTIPPTSTPIPTHTFTPLPPTPTHTVTPSPTNTPIPAPTDTPFPTNTPAYSLTSTPTLVQLTIDEPLYAGVTVVLGDGRSDEIVVVRDMDDLRIASAGIVDGNGRYAVDLGAVLQAYGKDGLEAPHTIQAEMEKQICRAVVRPRNVVKDRFEIFLPFVYAADGRPTATPVPANTPVSTPTNIPTAMLTVPAASTLTITPTATAIETPPPTSLPANTPTPVPVINTPTLTATNTSTPASPALTNTPAPMVTPTGTSPPTSLPTNTPTPTGVVTNTLMLTPINTSTPTSLPLTNTLTATMTAPGAPPPTPLPTNDSAPTAAATNTPTPMD